ncbi:MULTISPECIES: ribosome modulation factor [Bacteria]|uniref:ribosome modulation factor n=1 Tax=Bacteria TaxID=2 RepID=UPI00338E2022
MRRAQAFSRGYAAHGRGLPVDENPYAPGTDLRREWNAGWHSADIEYMDQEEYE